MKMLQRAFLALLFVAVSTPAMAWVNWKALVEGAPKTLILATTTSVQDTGLLDVLLPRFEKKTGISVKPIAVGSGQALALGAKGEADVLFVHSPKAEASFMKAGDGATRKLVAHNFFLIVGPKKDPARVKGTTPVEAFRRISRKEATFVSRGDESGTHAREKSLWQKAGIEPKGAWYQSTGTGMGATLQVAAEKSAYTLTDKATYLFLKKRLGLFPMVEGGDELKNIYHVITVDPEKHPGVNEKGARAFATFLTDPETQKVIGQYGRERFGETLFVPDAK